MTIDYRHHSLCELLFEQAEIIAAQAKTIEDQFRDNVELATENLELRESADDAIAGEYHRLVEGLLLVEAWARTLAAREPGEGAVDAESLVRVIGECFEWCENKRKPPWYEAAVRAMGGLS